MPHTRLFAWVRPNPEPSYRLVQETQAGQLRRVRPIMMTHIPTRTASPVVKEILEFLEERDRLN
jgi:hypothetical protein